MVLAADTVDRKKKLLEESYVLIERLRRLRALNVDPRMVGMNSRIPGARNESFLLKAKRRFR